MTTGTASLRRAAAAALLAATLSGAAAAQTLTPDVDLRHREQSGRIVEGVHKGELSSGEAGRLMSRQAQQRAEEDRLKSDGVVTIPENRTLYQQQNLLDREIKRLRSN